MNGDFVTDIPLYKRFKQAMTRRPKMKVTASESEQSSFSYWLKEKNRISSYIAEINNFAELVHTISLPTLLTVNQGNAEILPAKKTLRLRSKEMLGMGLKKKRPHRVFDFGKIVGGKQMSNDE
jgi:predicted membrane-bound mannosyltransferase